MFIFHILRLRWLTVLKNWRNKWQGMNMVRVNCWFCQAASHVPPGNENAFDCPECDQYNGFSEDGHYNKPIPAQYSEELNHVHSRPVGCHDNKPSPLCSVCQINQELKVQQLAAFVPSHEEHFDSEVEEYSQYLEGAYRLCPACQAKVSSELGRQDRDIHSKLLGQRINQAIRMSTMGVSHPCSNRRSVALLRTLAIFFAFLVVVSDVGSILVDVLPDVERTSSLENAPSMLSAVGGQRSSVCVAGLVCSIVSSILAGKYRLKYADCLCPFLWMICAWRASAHSSSLRLLLQAIFPSMLSPVLPLLLSTSLVAICLQHAWQARARRTRKVFTNKISRNSCETELMHQTVEGENAMPASYAAPAAETDSSAMSSSGESSEIKKILLDQAILDGLSLGPPSGIKPKNKDIWTAHTPPTSRPATPLSEDRPPSHEFRPVISPATFNPCGLKRTASRSSFASSFHGALDSAQPQDQSITSTREPFNFPDSRRGSCVPSLADDSSDESFPLGMTAKGQSQAIQPCKPPSSKSHPRSEWPSFVVPCAFGFSLGINFAAALYLMYGR